MKNPLNRYLEYARNICHNPQAHDHDSRIFHILSVAQNIEGGFLVLEYIRQARPNSITKYNRWRDNLEDKYFLNSKHTIQFKDLRGILLTPTDFDTAAILPLFMGNDLEGAIFQGLQISDLEFRNCNLNHCLFKNCNLGWGHFRYCTFEHCVFEDCDLHCALLSGFDLTTTRFVNCNLSEANFMRSNLTGIDLSTSTGLIETEMNGACLKGANLKGLNLTHINLAGANLRGSNLEGADLTGCYMKKTKLQGANLKNTNFTEAVTENPIIDSRTNLKGMIGAEYFKPTTDLKDTWTL